ncbi:MAG: hypothetical protein AAFO75_00910 [Pseudomonadota bacterium]
MGLALASVALVGITSSPIVAQQTKPDITSERPIMVLFDSSGSMWGKLPGNRKPKFELAQQALINVLDAPLKTRPSGLVIFGRSCTSAPLYGAITSRTPNTLLKPIDRLNPRGKGPLTLAMETAAASLPTNAASDVIIVHDGADNCRRDACAFATQISQSHPKLRFHLLSIAIAPKDEPTTRCIAEKTGGSVHAATDAPSIMSAALNLAQQLGGHSATPPKTPVGKEKPISQDTPPPLTQEDLNRERDRKGPSRIVLSATLGADGPTVKRPIAWTLRQAGDDPAKPPVMAKSAPTLASRLPAGTYVVEAKLDGFTSQIDVAVPEVGAARKAIAINAGRISLSSPAITFEDGLLVTLSQPDQSDGQASKKVFTRSFEPMLLTPGSYVITARSGTRFERHSVDLAQGSDVTTELFKGYGQLSLSLLQSDGRRPSTPVDVLIETDAPDQPNGRRVIAKSTSTTSSHLLPAATYYVSVSVGGVASTQQIAVPAKARLSRTFTLQAATLRPQVRLAPDNLTLRRSTPVLFTVEDLQKRSNREVAWSSDPSPKFHLSPGRYQITARIGPHNVSTTKTIEMKPGESRTIVLNGEASEIALELAGQNAGRPTDRLWEIQTSDGETVWRTNAPKPKGLLSPGTYIVRCVTKRVYWKGCSP